MVDIIALFHKAENIKSHEDTLVCYFMEQLFLLCH